MLPQVPHYVVQCPVPWSCLFGYVFRPSLPVSVHVARRQSRRPMVNTRRWLGRTRRSMLRRRWPCGFLHAGSRRGTSAALPPQWLVAGSTPAPGDPESCWLPLCSQHSARLGLQPGKKTARWKKRTKRKYEKLQRNVGACSFIYLFIFDIPPAPKCAAATRCAPLFRAAPALSMAVVRRDHLLFARQVHNQGLATSVSIMVKAMGQTWRASQVAGSDAAATRPRTSRL